MPGTEAKPQRASANLQFPRTSLAQTLSAPSACLRLPGSPPRTFQRVLSGFQEMLTTQGLQCRLMAGSGGGGVGLPLPLPGLVPCGTPQHTRYYLNIKRTRLQICVTFHCAWANSHEGESRSRGTQARPETTEVSHGGSLVWERPEEGAADSAPPGDQGRPPADQSPGSGFWREGTAGRGGGTCAKGSRQEVLLQGRGSLCLADHIRAEDWVSRQPKLPECPFRR